MSVYVVAHVLAAARISREQRPLVVGSPVPRPDRSLGLGQPVCGMPRRASTAVADNTFFAVYAPDGLPCRPSGGALFGAAAADASSDATADANADATQQQDVDDSESCLHCARRTRTAL